MSENGTILYCRCAYGDAVPRETCEAVLERLCAGDAVFEAAADLCELAARGDSLPSRLAERGPLTVLACHARAVRWLLERAGVPDARVIDMTRLDPGSLDEALDLRPVEGSS